MTDYDPQVAMDLHTTNGSRHGYYLTYAPPLNPATDPAIIDLLRKDWLPSVTKTIKSKYNWDYYYYGNLEGRDTERAWRSFDDRPRFNNSYVGLRNRIAILSEAYAYATFQDRIKATSRFVEEVLNYAKAHAEPIKKLTADADRRVIVGSKVALRAEMEKSADAVEILIGDVTEEKNPVSGGDDVPPLRHREARDDARVRHLQGHRNRARAVGVLRPGRPYQGDRQPPGARHGDDAAQDRRRRSRSSSSPSRPASWPSARSKGTTSGR